MTTDKIRDNASERSPKYNRYFPVWTKVRDCYEGAVAVKDKKEVYLPIPSRNSVDNSTSQRYNSYLVRASFFDIVGPTIDVMQGSIFRREPTIKIPEEIQYILDDATGTDTSLNQMAQDIILEVAITGREGILVDQLPVPEGMNKAEEELLGIMPRFKTYRAEDIINWEEDVINGVKKPVLIVLQEEITEPDDYNRFERKTIQMQRVLELDSAGVYRQTLWKDDVPQAFEDGSYEITPTKKGGETFDTIPFVFLGVNSNTSKIDKPPLLPLADLVLGHYRNSADLEMTCFLVANPTLVITGVDQNWVDQNLKSGINLGSDSALCLPVGATTEMLQASPNNLVAGEMVRKEDRMLKLGVRASDGTSGRETATAAKIRTSADEAIMSKLSKSGTNGITKALGYLYEYVTGEKPAKDTVSYCLNMKFYPTPVDSQLVISLLAAYDAKTITLDELRDNLFELGIMIDDESDLDELREQMEESAEVASLVAQKIPVPEPVQPQPVEVKAEAFAD